jgi:hypothetical protein
MYKLICNTHIIQFYNKINNCRNVYQSQPPTFDNKYDDNDNDDEDDDDGSNSLLLINVLSQQPSGQSHKQHNIQTRITKKIIHNIKPLQSTMYPNFDSFMILLYHNYKKSGAGNRIFFIKKYPDRNVYFI